MRRRNREERFAVEAGETVGPAAIESGGDEDAVKQALETLPEKYRLPVWLHHGQGLPFREIADVLGVKEPAARMEASRGLNMLRDRLARERVPLPLSAVLAAIPLLYAESAPASLVERITELVRSGGGLAGTGAATGVSAGKMAAILGGAAGTAALIGTGVWLKHSEPRMPAPTVETVASAAMAAPWSGFNYHWDFNTPELPPEFLLQSDSRWRHVADGGPDGSGCLETESDIFTITFNVPIESLPILVSAQAVPVSPVPSGDHTLVFGWDRYLDAAAFHGVGERPTIPMHYKLLESTGQVLGNWYSCKNYVSEKSVCRLADKYVYDVTFYRRHSEGRLMFVARGRHRIDNLTIRSIRPEDFPDVSKYQKAIERIPPEKRKGEVPVPELKPGPRYKRVWVTFHSAEG